MTLAEHNDWRDWSDWDRALASREPIISPAWSPDGKALAYVSFESGKAVVWSQDVSSGERRAIANFRDGTIDNCTNDSIRSPPLDPAGWTLSMKTSFMVITRKSFCPSPASS